MLGTSIVLLVFAFTETRITLLNFERGENMGRRMTLDEYLEAFTDEETESVPDAISVRVSDAEVHSLGLFFIQLMGGVAQCLRRPAKRRLRYGRGTRKKERGASDPLPTDLTEERTNDDDDL